MCDHDNLVRVQNGWFCPDCGQLFEERPTRPIKITFLNTEEKPKKTPAKKPNKSSEPK